MSPLIRAAAASDIPAITGIYEEAVRFGTATFELDPPDLAEMDRRRRALMERGFPYLVAERAGDVVGYAYAGPYRERRAYENTVEDSVYLAATARRRGFGSLLLTALIAAAADRGFRQMVAVIGDSDNAASIRLHARCGFVMVGTLRAVGWKHGRWLDTVLMQMPLGLGADRPAGD